ncbi:MAG: outer membrane beta-barrel protein [Nitrospira sp.]|nr:outer membrane beta-barrel protein [Nitrospira sp.]
MQDTIPDSVVYFRSSILRRCPAVILITLFLMWGIAFVEARADTPESEGDETLDHVALRHKGTPRAVAKRLLSEDLGLRLYGYLEGSYTQNFSNPSNNINQLRIFDVNSNQFRPNLAQFVLEREAKADGNWKDRAGFRVKFNVGRDSDFIGGVGLSTWADFQEFYVQYVAPVGKGLTIQLGQFNTLIGYEVVESPHNPNYSRSWLFGLGQPFTTRGGRLSYDITERISLSVGVIGYINSARGNSQHDSLMESALTISPFDRVKLTMYGLAGPRPGMSGTPGGDLLLVGGFASFQATDQTSFVLESYYANQANSSRISEAGNARWNGVAGYVIHDFTKQWGVRLRGELFEDAGGFVTCEGTTAYQPRANVCFGATSTSQAPPVAQTLWEVTSTLQYKPFKSLITRLEYRYDKSNQNVFQIGSRATSYQSTLSLEVIYLF